MGRPEAASTSGEAAAAAVTVRYWASAKAAAGRPEDRVAGATVAEAIAAARRCHGEGSAFARVLAISTLLLGDKPLGSSDLTQVALTDGDVIEVLPPFAGG
ncbi:MAG: MoaD/ThiS family protein [Nocardioidaceae bacterium]